MRNGSVAVGIVLLLLAGCDDDDDDIIDDIDDFDEETFEIQLSVVEEVPVCASAGSFAQGTAFVTLSGDDRTITVNELTFSGLSSTVTGAHIHAGQIGVAGPIVFPLGIDPTSLSFGQSFDAASYPSPVPAGAPLNFQQFVVAMIAGETYINVHTVACPLGEIRGQLL